MQYLDILNSLDAVERRLAKYRNNKKLENYNTGELVHQKQLIFHQNVARNRWVFGGNRSGKSECGAV